MVRGAALAAGAWLLAAKGVACNAGRGLAAGAVLGGMGRGLVSQGVAWQAGVLCSPVASQQSGLVCSQTS